MTTHPRNDEAPNHQEVRDAGRAHIRAAWAVLVEERVLPVPIWRRFLSVGSDYFGFLDHETYERFEAALASSFPRLSPDRPVGEREFASMFVHSVLQVCVARAAELGDSEVLPDAVLDQALDDLIVALSQDLSLIHI